ncbi:uncharacterized protein LOC116207255 [Punica granatum]|uniref:Late embryogenesis abundant protein LEA-2 subgroup domain-containing protein n=2 Tax=Punica granatum TaxID=22663 RepID=A0A218WGZ8_PUNGR|nr:uncharacterized protein LOC116207255 [Punica granatum]OWM72095.1 hypothetical protein CDL15_Pgr017978 [Punica granatum]PKI56903.1 hypothetical protein CRG98_022732 [Punica granatum]
MAEKTSQQVYPLAPANGAPRSDEEALTEKEAKRKKRVKLALYIGAFAVFQVIVILVFVMVVMRVHRPKFRVGELRIQSLNTGSQNSTSFDMSFVAPIRVKNANFGPYKYDATTVVFTYGGVQVGQAAVPKSKANFKSTKKIDLTVTVSSSNLTSVAAASSALESELRSGNLTLRSQATMTGKVELMLIFKKKKSTFMDCTMVINASTQAVQSLACK